MGPCLVMPLLSSSCLAPPAEPIPAMPRPTYPHRVQPCLPDRARSLLVLSFLACLSSPNPARRCLAASRLPCPAEACPTGTIRPSPALPAMPNRAGICLIAPSQSPPATPRQSRFRQAPPVPALSSLACHSKVMSYGTTSNNPSPKPLLFGLSGLPSPIPTC